MTGFDHEVFAVLFLDSQLSLIDYAEMFHGTIDCASVYPREIVKEALRLNAAAVVVSHNHPSGNPDPAGLGDDSFDCIDPVTSMVDVSGLPFPSMVALPPPSGDHAHGWNRCHAGCSRTRLEATLRADSRGVDQVLS